MLDPIHYYNPETTLFPELADRFQRTGNLTDEELYLILDWKAPRARTYHLKRLATGRTFSQAAQQLGREVHRAATDELRLKSLMVTPWNFALPTATAILTVLYPERFTMYDIRVCEELGDFKRLAYHRWSHQTWPEYERFVDAVRLAVPGNLTLRDGDRWLFGRNKRKGFTENMDSVSAALAPPITA